MSKVQDAIALAKAWAADGSHGYDQVRRWGPDYDCSSFLIEVWEQCGVKVKTAGATYTGNMRAVFQRCGFEIIASWTVSTLQPGDVLLNDVNHTAMYIGNGQIVQASINEKGTTTGGQTGDQTGREIAVRSYYNFPWNCVLRYKEESTPSTNSSLRADASQLIKNPSNVVATPTDLDTIAREVINGKWGNGLTRKERLTAAGYNYAEVQARVNEMLR